MSAFPQAFTQHHVEIVRRKLLETGNAFYLDLLNKLVENNPILMVSDEGFNYNQLLQDNPQALGLFELILHSSEPDLPNDV